MTRLVPPAAGDPHGLDDLRLQVRQFVAEQQQAGRIGRSADCWLTGWDEDFTRALVARGWLGMTARANRATPSSSTPPR